MTSMLEKTNFSFDWSNNTGAIDIEIDGEIDGFVFEKKSSVKKLGLPFSLKLDCRSIYYLYC